MTSVVKLRWKTENDKDIFKKKSMELDNNQLLRFTTAGSVDDGKSTLIGRLLYDSKAIFEDQLEAVESTSKRKGHEGVSAMINFRLGVVK